MPIKNISPAKDFPTRLILVASSASLFLGLMISYVFSAFASPPKVTDPEKKQVPPAVIMPQEKTELTVGDLNFITLAEDGEGRLFLHDKKNGILIMMSKSLDGFEVFSQREPKPGQFLALIDENGDGIPEKAVRTIAGRATPLKVLVDLVELRNGHTSE